MAIEVQAFGQVGAVSAMPMSVRAVSLGAASAGAESGLRGLRLTRRGRIVVWLMALAVAAGVVLGGGRALAGEASTSTVFETVTVRAGQTLWEIAADVTPPGADVRDVIAEIRDANGLASTSLQIGQQIYVPVVR